MARSQALAAVGQTPRVGEWVLGLGPQQGLGEPGRGRHGWEAALRGGSEKAVGGCGPQAEGSRAEPRSRGLSLGEHGGGAWTARCKGGSGIL